MATEVFRISDAPGNNVYFVFWNAAGNLLDHADTNFEAHGAATTKGLAATENATKGGVSESSYEASLNLSYLNNTPAILVFHVEAYRRAGASIDLAADLLLTSGEIRVASAKLSEGSVGDLLPGYRVRCGFNTTSTIGDQLQLYAWLEYDGKPVTAGLAGVECVFDCFEFSSDVEQFDPTDPVTISDNGQWETTVDDPNLADDTEYLLKATITIGGVDIVGYESLVVVGGA